MVTNFQVHGFYCTSNWGGYVIEISRDGSSARVASDFGEGIQRVGRWQEIKLTQGGAQYVNYRGQRMHLDKFMRA